MADSASEGRSEGSRRLWIQPLGAFTDDQFDRNVVALPEPTVEFSVAAVAHVSPEVSETAALS